MCKLCRLQRFKKLLNLHLIVILKNCLDANKNCYLANKTQHTKRAIVIAKKL